MKALFKLVLGLLGLVFVAVLAVIVAVATLDPNQHKDWIIAKVEEKTGRTLALDGEIGLSLYPWLGVELNGLTLGNAAGFDAQPFLHLDHFKARIKLLPLLREQYEIDTVRIHGAALNLARNKDGVTNWADLAGGEAEPKPLPLTAIVLGGVDIQKTQLTWSDASTDTRYEIRDLTVATGELTYGEPIKLSLALIGTANKPALDGDVKMNGVIAYDLDTEKYSIKPLELSGTLRGKNVPGGQTSLSVAAAVDVNMNDATASVSDLKLTALDTAVAGRLDAANIRSPRPAIKAALNVQGSDLALLFKVAEIEPLAGQLARVQERKFDLQTRLDADLERGDLDVPEFKANLLGAAIAGEIKAANIESTTPAVKGSLNAAGPDLPNLLQVAGQFQGGEHSFLSGLGQQLAKAPDQAFEIKTTFDADWKRGDLDVPALSLQLAGATLQGHIKAGSVQTPTPSLKGAVNAFGPDLPLFMRLTGRAQAGQAKDSPLVTYGKQLAAMPDKAFAIKAEFDGDLRTGNIDIPALSIQTLGVDVSGELKAKEMQSDAGSVAGRLAVSGEKMPELLRALKQPDLAEVLRSVKLEAGISGSRGDLSLKPMALQAVLASKEIRNSPVTVSLNADTRINLDAQSLQLDNFTVQGLGLNVRGDVKANKFKEAPEFSGQLAIAEFNLRQLMNQLKQKPPQTADAEVLKKVALKSQFSGARDSLSLNQLVLNLDDSNLQGNFSMSGTEKRTVRFGIEVDQFDADRYLPPEPAGAAPPQQAAKKKLKLGNAASAAAKIPVELLRSLDIQGNFTIGKLTISNARLNNVKLTLSGKDGLLKLDPIAARLYQGQHSGNISMDATGKLPRLTINSKLHGIQAEPLLRDVMGEAKLRGTGNFSAALVAAGADVETMKQTLNGQMSFRLEDAALKGVNFGKILRQGKSLKESFSLSVSESEETDLSEVVGNPVAQNGVIRMDDLSGKAPGLRLAGKGVLADLPHNQINYQLTAYLVATSEGQGGKDLQAGKLDGVPLDCYVKGSLDDPKRDCDASKLVAALGIRLLQEVLGVETKPAATQTTPTESTGATPRKKKQKPKPAPTTAPTAPTDPAKELLDKTLKDIFD